MGFLGLGRKDKDQSKKEEKKEKETRLPDSSYTWGITPPKERRNPEKDPDHPIHKIPLEKQEKWRKKGIDPVARAEMDEALKGEGGFWTKVGMTSMGGGYIK